MPILCTITLAGVSENTNFGSNPYDETYPTTTTSSTRNPSYSTYESHGDEFTTSSSAVSFPATQGYTPYGAESTQTSSTYSSESLADAHFTCDALFNENKSDDMGVYLGSNAMKMERHYDVQGTSTTKEGVLPPHLDDQSTERTVSSSASNSMYPKKDSEDVINPPNSYVSRKSLTAMKNKLSEFLSSAKKSSSFFLHRINSRFDFSKALSLLQRLPSPL